MRRFAVATFVAISFCACSGGNSGGTADAGTNPPGTVTTSLAGIVLDDASGNPLAGVEVRAHGKTISTGADGAFFIPDISSPVARCALVARKDGYFVAGKASAPIADGTTRFRLRLVKKEPLTVSATGGTVTLAGGAQVAFSASSFAQDGQTLEESVEVSARHLNPVAQDFDQQFPGNLRATREDGSPSMMVSFGVIQVEMNDVIGEPVELVESKPATLTFPVPESMQGRAPATIPLWYFDMADAMWKEQGAATLEGDRYVGQVTHFTPWNVDVAEDTAFVAGVVLCGGKPVGGVRISAGPNVGFSGSDGRFLIEVPANAPLTVRIDDELARDGAVKSAGPIPPGETEDVGAFELDICPARFTGRVVDTKGEPKRASVRLSWKGGVNLESTDAQGRFRTQVSADADVTLDLSTPGGEATATTRKKAPGSGEETDLGDIVVGAAAGCEFWDLEVDAFHAAISPDGARIAVREYDSPVVTIRDLKTGAAQHTISTQGQDMQFSQDGKRLLVGEYLSAAVPGVWDVASGTLVRAWPGFELAGAWLMPDGASLLGINGDSGKVEQYAVADGSVLRSFGLVVSKTHGFLIGLRADGRQFLLLTIAGDRRTVTVWSMDTDAEVASFTIEGSGTMGQRFVAVSGDGGVVAFPRFSFEEASSRIDFFDTGTGNQINTQSLSAEGNTEHLALGPDGSFFVTHQSIGSRLDLPRLYALPGMEVLRTLPWQQNSSVDEFVFSSDGRYLGMVESGSKVRIVDLTTCP